MAGVFGVFVENGRFVVVDVVGVQTARALLVAVGAEVVAEEHGWVVGGFADLAFVVEVDSEFRHEFREMRVEVAAGSACMSTPGAFDRMVGWEGAPCARSCEEGECQRRC